MAQSSPLLSLFKGQLETECAALAKKCGLTRRGSSLIYWYFMRLHDFTEAEVVEVLCDGANDLAIDAIWIDDDDFVHFYQFKHPEDASKGIAGGDVDKMISGLRLILSRKHDQIANQELRGRLEEVYLQVRNGYRIHMITSGEGVPYESRVKLDTLVDELGSPTASIIQWDQQTLTQLQDEFYRQSLPAVKESIQLAVPDAPYASALRRGGMLHVLPPWEGAGGAL